MRPAISRIWRRTGPNMRFAAGLLLIALVGSLGLAPKSLFGVAIPWPYAALWGAAGWGASGLALRPMLALSALGFAQDLTSVGPLGVFMLANLSAYAAAAALSDALGSARDAAAQAAAPALSIAAGVFAIWLLASGVEDHPVSAGPLLGAFVTTLLGFVVVAPLYRLTAPGRDLQGRSA